MGTRMRGDATAAGSCIARSWQKSQVKDAKSHGRLIKAVLFEPFAVKIRLPPLRAPRSPRDILPSFVLFVAFCASSVVRGLSSVVCRP